MGIVIAYDDEKEHYQPSKPAIHGCDNSVALAWKTFETEKTKLPDDLEWKANALLSEYQSCSVKCDGQERSGQGYKEHTSSGSLSRCKVHFNCPDGLE
jgi:hypothetical protein